MAKTTTLQRIIAEAKRIQKVHTHMSWKEAIKDASKHIKEGAKTVVKKAATKKAIGSYIKLTKKEEERLKYLQSKEDYDGLSPKENTEYENLVIKYRKTKDYKGNKPYMERLKDTSIEALPVNFVGSFIGFKFKIVNQYTIDGGVTCQIVQYDPPGDIITQLNGRDYEVSTSSTILFNNVYKYLSDLSGEPVPRHNQRSRILQTVNSSIEIDSDKFHDQLKKKIKNFVELLHKDVKNFNKGKDKNIVVSKPTVKELAAGIAPTVKRKKEFKPKVTTSKAGTVDQIKSVLKANHKILTHGYSIKPGKVREKKIAGHEEDFEAIIEGWMNEGKEMVVKQLAYYESKRYMANTKLEKNKIARKIYDLKKKFLKFKK